MKFYVKLVIFIVILFIIILLLRKKIPILKETFDNVPSPSPSYIHSHSNDEAVDDKSMNVILINLPSMILNALLNCIACIYHWYFQFEWMH